MDTRKKIQFPMKKISALAGVLSAGVFLSLSLQVIFSHILVPTVETRNQQASVIQSANERVSSPFDGITLGARSVYVFDLANQKVLFVKNENEKLPLASITKIMTALVARDHMQNGVVVTLTKNDLSAEGDSGLRPGERWRMGDLLDVMLIISSNDAAHAIAGFVGRDGQTASPENIESSLVRFIQMMNEKARTLGLTTMEFYNESGLDIDKTKNGGYGSARDVTVLVSELWKKYPDTLEITARKDARIVSQDDIAHYFPNTNEALGHFSGIIASKTGYTDIAGGNLAIIFDVGIGHPVVAVVLGSTYKGRFEDMQKLTQATLKVLE